MREGAGEEIYVIRPFDPWAGGFQGNFRTSPASRFKNSSPQGHRTISCLMRHVCGMCVVCVYWRLHVWPIQFSHGTGGRAGPCYH